MLLLPRLGRGIYRGGPLRGPSTGVWLCAVVHLGVNVGK